MYMRLKLYWREVNIANGTQELQASDQSKDIRTLGVFREKYMIGQQ